ncbi:error-prone DNA polymerase [Parvibaculaceae bacterium PLY_AMNH_Bact1]|nr:error-prone DNA polymerase [Parvibaculaceae bacterium PLY_AMNH_Bact1]
MTSFAELAITSNFSFLRGASHGDELGAQAIELGLSAIGVADRNTFAGIVRAHKAAKDQGLRFLPGVRLITQDGFEVIAYPQDRPAYARLCRLLTLGNRRAPKGECYLTLHDITSYGEGQCFIAMAPSTPGKAFEVSLCDLSARFPDQVWLGLNRLYTGDDKRRMKELARLSRVAEVPLVATNDVLYHAPERRQLQDVMTCIREHCTIHEAGFRLEANAERHLKGATEMVHIFRGYEEAVSETARIVERCTFSLDELAYEYPDDVFDDALTPQALLEKLTWDGVAEKFPDGITDKLRDTLTRELELIHRLKFAPYFLTVYDIVRFAESQHILCQGRGSAANSAVCYCLGITAVNPVKVDLLFERFISEERNEPPDIDVDFEHERREEVIQYIYQKYGRDRAGLAATVITYRARSAIREVGKAMGLSEDVVGAMARMTWGWSSKGVAADEVRQAGLDPDDPLIAMALSLAGELIGFPRHLSQHVGGFVITRGALEEVVPIQNAAMEDRTIVEWDKDDLDTLGILKIDVLALGMLSCIRKAFDLLETHYGIRHGLRTVPEDDPAVYDMLCQADSVGVFQVESRAQMSMLPRLKPRTFYDLVVEVAIVRPGPIQGDMVHPYLRRRNGEEPVEFPSDELREVLGKTMGVPLFQEQAMKIAIVAAGFTPPEADGLRRAMATFRRNGTIYDFEHKFIGGMVARGYEQDFAERCFKQIEGFGDYGFPESHAASFALLVYVSAWLKCHYPDVFCAAILNSQPMGFYAPAQLVRDAKEHGVEVLPADVNSSDWDSTLEPLGETISSTQANGQITHRKRWKTKPRHTCAVRLGLRHIKGFREEAAELVEDKRLHGYDSVRDLWLRTGLSPRVIEILANADAFRSIGLDRRDALWGVRGLGGWGQHKKGQNGKAPAALPLFEHLEQAGFQEEPDVHLPAMPLGEQVVHDYATMRLSLKAHPVSFLRAQLEARRVVTNARLADDAIRDGARVNLAGLVLVRQRPGTASGVIFATLEDETGVANIIIWPKIFERYRRTVLQSRFLGVRGRVQKAEGVIHVVSDWLEDWTHELAGLTDGQYEIGDNGLAHADEVKRPGEDPRTRSLQKLYERQLRAARLMPKSRDFH